VDDARIAELTAEVLADLRTPAAPGTSPASTSALEARVVALENAFRGLRRADAPAPLGVPVAVALAAAPRHPSHELVGPSAAGDRCVLEPDKPCVGSGQCRSFGY
jgi:hypothetical protein